MGDDVRPCRAPALVSRSRARAYRGDAPVIESWHAHIYFDANSRDAAWALRARIPGALGNVVTIGRFHERPVGPHPQWSFQLAFAPDALAHVVSWLVLHRAGLDVFAH